MNRKPFWPFEKLKPLYKFLFMEHDIGFFRFCLAMLIPAAIWPKVCYWWMWVLVLLQYLTMYGRQHDWNRFDD